jgi:DNA-binding transcriptional ArsR family regulator
MNTLDHAFGAIADPTRRAILARLALGEANVGALSEPFSISAPAISRHLRVLEAASLITNERIGKNRICRINPAMLKAAADWLEHYRQFWAESFDRLDEHLKSTEGTKP